MKIINRIQTQALILLLILPICGCWSQRVHRLTDVEYTRKGKDAPIEMVVGKWSKAYESIATIDSDTYSKKDPDTKSRMLEDLRKRARNVGADAVQDIRLLPVKVKGVVLDEGVPVAGAWKQGTYDLYFLRGEAIKFVEKAGATPGDQNPRPADLKEQNEKKKKKKKSSILKKSPIL